MSVKQVQLSLALFMAFLVGGVWGCKAHSPGANVRKSDETVSITPIDKGHPTDVVLILDQSGSMNGTAQSPPTDPKKVRVEATKYLINNVARRSKTRIGIVSFGTQAEIDAPLTEIDGPSALEQLCSLVTAKNLGRTNFIVALTAAKEIFEKAGTFREGIKPIIILFTDGSPDDGSAKSVAAHFEEMGHFMETHFKPYRADLYVVGIDDTGSNWTKSQLQWSTLVGEKDVFTITKMDELRRVFNQIIHPEMRVDNVTAAGAEFLVPPYLDSIELHVFPAAPNLELAIRRPDGATVDAGTDKDVTVEKLEKYDVITVKDPAVGTWQYHVAQGDGTIEVYRNPIPIQVQVVSPAPVEPLGRGFFPKVILKRQDGSLVKELPEYPLRLVARFAKPEQAQPIDVLLTKTDESLYCAADTVQAEQTGKWEMSVLISGGHDYSFSTTALFEVALQPYLQISKPESPVVPYGEGLAVQARLLVNREPAVAAKSFTDPALNLVLAQLKNLPQGGDSPTVFMDPIDNGSTGEFQAYIPVSLASSGNATLALQMRGSLTQTGTKVTDTALLQLTVRPDSWQMWTGRLYLSLLVILALLILGALLTVVWYLRLPVMNYGSPVDLVGAGAAVMGSYNLDGQRLVRIPVRSLLAQATAMQEPTMSSMDSFAEQEQNQELPALPASTLKPPRSLWIVQKRQKRGTSDGDMPTDTELMVSRTLLGRRTSVTRGEQYDIAGAEGYYLKF